MPTDRDSLVLADAQTVDDLRTFVTRARALVPEGYVRLVVVERALTATVLVRTGAGLLGAGTVTAIRGFALGAPAGCDVVVELSAVSDRLARLETAETGEPGFVLPPVLRSTPWAAMSPPRTNWSLIGEFDPDEVASVERAGRAELSAARSAGSTPEQLAQLDQVVWSRYVGVEPGRFIAGLALGAAALGFLGGDPVRFVRHGSWQRLSTPAGDVLAH